MFEDQIKLLRQIQHLVLIREEEAKIGSGTKMEELGEQYRALVAKLDPELVAQFKPVAAKDKIFMSPLSKGNCSACGVKIPMATMQHVLAKDKLTVCNNCGRILYVPEVKATGIRTTEPDPKFPLSRFSTPKLMVNSLKATTREEAIAELGELLAKEKIISDPQTIIAAALEREHILTTAVGKGLAFPHMRGVEEGLLTFAVGAAPAGIDWDGQMVNLVFFTVLPVVASPFYLKLIAALAKTFEDGEKMPFLLMSGDGKTLWKELNKATRVAIKNIQSR